MRCSSSSCFSHRCAEGTWKVPYLVSCVGLPLTRAKALLSSVLELVQSGPDTTISLSIDASDTHLGAVLQQLLDGSWAPLAFYSMKLSDAEKKYSSFNRELLAVYSFLRHFKFMLEGREFTIFKDHKPLTLALFRVSPPWSAYQQRHLSYLV